MINNFLSVKLVVNKKIFVV